MKKLKTEEPKPEASVSDRLNEFPLRLPGLDRNLWIVKVPEWLAEQWDKQQPGSEIGQLVYENRPIGQKMTFTPSQEARELPKKYLIQTPPQQSAELHVLSSKTDKDGSLDVAYEGKQARRLDISPELNAEYFAYIKSRSTQALKPKPAFTKYNESDIQRESEKEQHKIIEAQLLATKAIGKDRPTDKRERMDETRLEARVLELLNKQEYWSFKELNEELQQPDMFLKAILKKHAQRIDKGDFRNKWTLKDELRTNGPRTLTMSPEQKQKQAREEDMDIELRDDEDDDGDVSDDDVEMVE